MRQAWNPYEKCWVALLCLLLTGVARGQRRSPERSLADRATQLNTDQQIALYQKQASSQPPNPHFQNLLASAYIQKVRESTDFTQGPGICNWE